MTENHAAVRRRASTRVLVVGAAPIANRLVEAIYADPAGRYGVVGIVAEPPGPSMIGRARPGIGTLSDLSRIVERLRPRLIVVALAERRDLVPVTQLLECLGRGIAIEDAADFHERLTGTVAVELQTPSGIIFSPHFRHSRAYRTWTRAFCIAASLVGLLVLSPLLLLVALAVKLDSAGPVLFIQPRVGAAGRTFSLLKFRTMRTASGSPVSEWVQDNGARITRVGRWLRKFRLDELPQLVNVLRGDMNLVGPRPHPVSNIDTLRVLSRNLSDVTGIDVPCYTMRTLVRPGITGWAQVRYGYANNFDQELEKLRYDLYYVKHASLLLDFRILVRTVGVVLRGHDAELVTPAQAGQDPHGAGGWARSRNHVKTA
jgi:exopolysaccharide biosynthesis polyprenyl glycosylphosphotransferase